MFSDQFLLKLSPGNRFPIGRAQDGAVAGDIRGLCDHFPSCPSVLLSHLNVLSGMTLSGMTSASLSLLVWFARLLL